MRKSKRARNLRLRILWIAMPISVMFTILVISAGGLAYAAHQEEKDIFCSSCHTQPETTYFERTQSATATDLASFHQTQNTRCIDCHSGQGVAGRTSAMILGANDLFHYLTGTAKQPAPLTVPIADVNCLKCHTDTSNTRDFKRHFHAFLPRWQAIDSTAATCVDCHASHTTFGKPNQIFLEAQSTRQVCEHCHAVLGGD